jgi:DinB superfamily
MDRQQLLRRLDRAWQAFRESYAGLSEKQMLEPGVTGAWSVRDIIAHVSTWEEEALQHLPTILKGNRTPRYSVTYGGIDAFNALMAAKKAGSSFSEVVRQQEKTHSRRIHLLKRVPGSEFTSETRFRRRLRNDTYGHYPIHAGAIRRWRERRQTRPSVLERSAP